MFRYNTLEDATPEFLGVAAAGYEAIDAQREYNRYHRAGWGALHSDGGVAAYVYRAQAENTFQDAVYAWHRATLRDWAENAFKMPEEQHSAWCPAMCQHPDHEG